MTSFQKWLKAKEARKISAAERKRKLGNINIQRPMQKLGTCGARPSEVFAQEKRRANGEKLTNQFRLLWRAINGPVVVAEFRFCESRKWRFDFAHPGSRVAIELECGVYSGGRHTRGSGFEGDCEKYNAAQEQGWRVFRFTGGMLSAAALERVAKVMWNERPTFNIQHPTSNGEQPKCGACGAPINAEDTCCNRCGSSDNDE